MPEQERLTEETLSGWEQDVKQPLRWGVNGEHGRERGRKLLRELRALQAERDEALEKSNGLQAWLGTVLDMRDEDRAAIKHLADQALLALSGAGICTPEKGYIAEPHALHGHIKLLARERDEARAEAHSLRARIEELESGEWDKSR